VLFVNSLTIPQELLIICINDLWLILSLLKDNNLLVAQNDELNVIWQRGLVALILNSSKDFSWRN
jgi:hypothetical protein